MKQKRREGKQIFNKRGKGSWVKGWVPQKWGAGSWNPLRNYGYYICHTLKITKLIYSYSVVGCGISRGCVGCPKNMHALSKILFKVSVCYFLSNFYFSPNDSPSKTLKIVFISSKNLLLFSRYSHFCIFVFPVFLLVSHCFRSWSKKKVYDFSNCLNKNLIL